MSNTYFKLLNKKLENEIITDIQKDLNNISYSNVVDSVLNSSNKNINNILKYYVINHLFNLNNSKTEYIDTPNKKIKRGLNNKYYQKVRDKYIEIKNIVSIDTNGSYTILEKFDNEYTIKKEYDSDGVILNFQLLNSKNIPIKNKFMIIKILNLKKEFVKKYKYSGVSGDSNDIVATFLNKLTSPVESGYYMDKWCNLYFWNDDNYTFVKETNSKINSPILTDYIFKNNNTVIRKEYLGKK